MSALYGILQHALLGTDLPDRRQTVIRTAILALGFLFCLLPQTARADDRCLEPGYLTHFDERLTRPQPCDDVVTAEIRWRGGTKLLRAIHPRSMPITDSAVFIGRIREAADAIGPALDKMGGDLSVDNITLLLTNYVSPHEERPGRIFLKGDYIAAATGVFENECPVSYYKDLSRSGGDDFVFTLAHEAFHCVQYSTWRGMPNEDWLKEGSAEYFAYLARPSFGPSFISQFDQDISRVPLSRMDYPAVVFYLWLGNAYGPPRVREFLASARSIKDAVPPDMLNEFAKAYFAPTIRMPDGRPLPSHPNVANVRAVHGSGTIASQTVTPYTFSSEITTFDRDKIYQLALLPAPPDARTAWHLEPGTFFGDMPTTISTCDGEKRYFVVRTTTASTRAGDINVTAQPATSSVCACPAGTWQETTASARRYFEQNGLGIYAGSESTRYITGYRLLVLNPDHTGSLTYVSVETETRGSPELTVNQTKTGGSHFIWKVVNGKLLTVLTGGNNLITLNNILTTPNGTRFETRQAGAQSIGHEFFCDESGLHLRQSARPPSSLPVPATTFNTNMDFVRVGGVP